MEGGIVMRQTDVAVVGAGPAGIAAALTAARSGAQVMLLDEGHAPGGHLRWTVSSSPGLVGAFAGHRGFEVAAMSAGELSLAKVEVVSQAVVWGLFEDRLLGVVASGESQQIRAERVILATGSTDIAYPFPGWELPGVMTARAALRLMHLYRVKPGERAVVVGAGPEADEVVEALGLSGIDVVATCATVDGVVSSGARAVEQVVVNGQTHAADTVVIALGKQPDPELALQALCEIGFSERDGVFVPLRSQTLETSIAGVYVAGDAAGICTLAEAYAEGAIAGAAATGGDIRAALDSLSRAQGEDRRRQDERLRLDTVSAR